MRLSAVKARVKDVYGPEAPYWTPIDVSPPVRAPASARGTGLRSIGALSFDMHVLFGLLPQVWAEALAALVLATVGGFLEAGRLRKAVTLKTEAKALSYDDVAACADLTPITPLQVAMGYVLGGGDPTGGRGAAERLGAAEPGSEEEEEESEEEEEASGESEGEGEAAGRLRSRRVVVEAADELD